MEIGGQSYGKMAWSDQKRTYQALSKYSRWSYEPLSYLWTYVEPDSDSSDDGSRDEGGKYQESLDDQEHE